jgi:hypothetical protein
MLNITTIMMLRCLFLLAVVCCMMGTTSAASSIRGGSSGEVTTTKKQHLTGQAPNVRAKWSNVEETFPTEGNSEKRMLQHVRRRAKKQTCVGADEFFELSVTLGPQSGYACEDADQVLLGHSINLLLLEYGIGDKGERNNTIFLAGVCPEPKPPNELSRWGGYIWKGGGTCRFCDPSDSDGRRATRMLVGGAFKLEIIEILTNAIHAELVPNHGTCLGANPKVTIDLVQTISQLEVDVQCNTEDGNGEGISVLDTLGHPNWASEGLTTCDKCTRIDFETTADGGVLIDGDWIGSQYGVKISAVGGYSPKHGEARIFAEDSSKIDVFDSAFLDSGVVGTSEEVESKYYDAPRFLLAITVKMCSTFSTMLSNVVLLLRFHRCLDHPRP